MTHLKAAFVAVMAVALSACGGSAGGEKQGKPGTASYSITAAFPADNGGLGNHFAGNYLKIVGTRDGTADSKYPCMSGFTLCLELKDDGTPVDGPIQDLCPSENTNDPLLPGSGTWKFEFGLYQDADCTQTLEMKNMICDPILGETLLANQTAENDVLCKTYNSTKTVDACVYDPNTGAGQECLPLDQFPDFDGDGIRDLWDPDDDNDGVADTLDLCPGTPAGTPVDATGCALPPSQFCYQFNLVGFTCPTGATQFCDTVPIVPTSAVQAAAACQTCYGQACTLNAFDSSGAGYLLNDGAALQGKPTFGFEYGSGANYGQPPGRIFRMLSSPDYGRWAPLP